jgi:hypothetical protein
MVWWIMKTFQLNTLASEVWAEKLMRKTRARRDFMQTPFASRIVSLLLF